MTKVGIEVIGADSFIDEFEELIGLKIKEIELQKDRIIIHTEEGQIPLKELKYEKDVVCNNCGQYPCRLLEECED